VLPSSVLHDSVLGSLVARYLMARWLGGLVILWLARSAVEQYRGRRHTGGRVQGVFALKSVWMASRAHASCAHRSPPAAGDSTPS
jgi:hypothetical protein